MDINELRPHIQSRIAHEFGNIFLDNLEFSVKNKLLEKDFFIQEMFDSPELAKQMLEQTGCDYVMIGRGAMGNPFLFEQVNDYLATGNYKKYSQKNKSEIFCKYLDYAVQYKIKFTNIRQQAMRFTKGLRGGSELRNKIMNSKNSEDLKNMMQEIF